MKIIGYFILFLVALSLLSSGAPGLFLAILLFLAWKIYEFFYYKSSKFISVKQRVSEYIKDCNELNQHIESLKDTDLLSNKIDYGSAVYVDSSKWNYKRKYLKNQKYAPHIHNCSRTVCDNARKKPFEYICKYFGIKANEAYLSNFEELLNNFEAAEEGKRHLTAEKQSILDSIQTDIPVLIKKFSKKRLERELGFENINLSTAYFPKYVFSYVSSGGNASTHCDIIMNIDNLNRFVLFVNSSLFSH